MKERGEREGSSDRNEGEEGKQGEEGWQGVGERQRA